MKNPAVRLIVAEDDDDDFLLMQEAFKVVGLDQPVTRVRDGQELLDHLLRRDRHAGATPQEHPPLILLDLNMPRMDGREALRQLKSHAGLRRIPVVVLTTSNNDEDIRRAYDLGANSYFRKPLRLAEFTRLLKVLKEFWLDCASFPVPAP